jgi:beta-glucosidase/6-phospho-beta-glucosidase/beta-galactosidase
MVAIYHWPMPLYLLGTNRHGDVASGAWENPDVAKHFRFYVESVISFLTDEDKVRNALAEGEFDKNTRERLLSEGLCRYFLSLNEPINSLLPPYMIGIFPPYKKGRVDLIKKVLGKLIEAHDIARDQIKTGGLRAAGGEPKVGIAHNWTYFDGPLGDVAHWLVNKKLTERFERNGEYTDFLGLQCYFRFTIPLLSRKGRIYGDNPYFGDIYPSGVHEHLKKMNREYPGKDIFITEFGFSDDHGLRRPYWILETVRYVIEALEHQIPVKGMLLWTLVNNFEWNLGLHQKFGLFDEGELNKPLVSSSEGNIKSWEAWRSAVAAVLRPSKESMVELQRAYDQARHQFKDATSKSQ